MGFGDIIFLVFIAFLGFGSYKGFKQERSVKKKANKTGDDYYRRIHYLGGHPIETEGEKYGALLINHKEIKFIKVHPSFGKAGENVFEINIEDINDCSLETKKEISSKRIALIGLLAFGLKKGKKYIVIKFEHKLGEKKLVLHDTKGRNDKIVKRINQIRMRKMNKNYNKKDLFNKSS